jgi:hypothetical protein
MSDKPDRLGFIPKVEYAQPLKQTSATFEGIIMAHKQTARSNFTVVRVTGCQAFDIPDLRGAGFNPGDEILIVIQGRVGPEKEKA